MTVVRALGLISGSLADAVFGDPARGHPVAVFGRAATAVERLLWRSSRAAGVVYVVALVLPVTAVAGAVDIALRRRPLVRFAFTSTVLWTVLGGRSLAREATRLADAVARDDLEEARRVVPALVGRDPSGLDGPELCRAAVESVAENTGDAVVGALLWGAVAGPAGAIAYRAVNTLDAMVGHRNERYERFGWAAARLDDLFSWAGARLGAVLAVGLAPLAGGEIGRGWRMLLRDGGRHPSPNAGRMEAAFAGALGVRLGGTNRYGARGEERPEIGEGPGPGVESVHRSVRLSGAVGAAAAALCALLAWRLGR